MSETVADIGELALIERLKRFCAEDVVGDDAALLMVSSQHQLVVTTDVLTDGVHFSDRTTPPYSVGWRATAANLSDLAAMGATAKGITIGLGLPGDTAWPWVESLYQGIADCLKAYGGSLLGGDLCRAAQRTVSITALGEVLPTHAIRRDAAEAGMSVVVTGPHGGSRAGLAALLGEIEVDASVAEPWIQAHQQPIPRFDAIAHLRQIIQQSAPIKYPTLAGMDSSDGLANALLQLSRSSRIGIDVLRPNIPLPAGLSTHIGPDLALEWALFGGEDFELVLCLPPNIARQFTSSRFATYIGSTYSREAHSHETVRLLSSTEDKTGIPLTHKSFQHF